MYWLFLQNVGFKTTHKFLFIFILFSYASCKLDNENILVWFISHVAINEQLKVNLQSLRLTCFESNELFIKSINSLLNQKLKILLLEFVPMFIL
jgi:hypothetical protein